MNMNVDMLREIFDRGLRVGKGANPNGQMCAEQALALACGLPMTDNPTKCSIAEANAYARIIQDSSHWKDEKSRADGMFDFVLTQAGTERLDGLEFSLRLVMATIREVLPRLLQSFGLDDQAKACEVATSLEEGQVAAEQWAAWWADAGWAAWAAADAADAARSADALATAATWAANADVAATWAAKAATWSADAAALAAKAAVAAASVAKAEDPESYLRQSVEIATRILREMKEPCVESSDSEVTL